jgi:hypothetical protein
MSRIDPNRAAKEDLFFFYDMDDVKIRWDHVTQTAYQKFFGEQEFQCKGWSYFNKASNEGIEITREEYFND